MDKKENLEITDEQVEQLQQIGQDIRDYTAMLFEKKHLTIREAIITLAAVTATFCKEFKEQNENTSLRVIVKLFLDCFNMFTLTKISVL